MLRTKLLTLFVVAITSQMAMISEAQAGPLLDWLRGIRRNKTCCPTAVPQTSFRPTTTPSVANLQPGQCLKTCQQTCSRTVVNYVPYTAYRTNWNRVPVTQYRPVTTTDPCTGCTMTCMKPCTTFTYKMQRVPYTTYRPCYRQETFKVPVTTLVNNCQSNTCPTTCDTCGTGSNMPAAQNFAPQQQNFSAPVFSPGAPQGGVPADAVPSLSSPTPAGSASRTLTPPGTLSTESSYQVQSAYQATPAFPSTPSYSTPAPTTATPHTAARMPDVNTATQGVRPQTNQRSFLERLQGQGGNNNSIGELRQAKAEPKPIASKTQLTSLHRRWSYSPARLASARSDSTPSRSTFSSVESRKQINSAWNDMK